LGLDVRDHAGKGRPISPVFKIMSGLKVGQQQLLRGNSMHIPSISMWLVYVLSHCVRRSDLQMLPVHIGSPGIEEENFDELD
jgi:hypothetical protein